MEIYLYHILVYFSELLTIKISFTMKNREKSLNIEILKIFSMGMSMRKKRGISPVIATVIIVAIAITVAIAVGLWITGIVGTFTRFERLEITSAYVSSKSDTGFTIKVIANNTGSAAATITDIFINGKPMSAAGADDLSESDKTHTLIGKTINPGEGIDGTITLKSDTTNKYTSGQTVEIVLHTASGKDYPKSVLLP
jgi:flagellin-like protein